MTWAQRLKRVFGIDIDVCARCGGQFKVIASIEEPEVIAKILAHLEKTAPGDGVGNASVGIASLPADHPLCGGSGTDNKVAIFFSDHYDVNPLAIQGPGAGAEVTAAALLDDVLKIA
jgi:homoserine dehydrogenase